MIKRMKTESSIRSQVALSLIPRLNNNLCFPLIERCGGIEGFFQESGVAMDAICREFNIPPNLFDRSKALQQASDELAQIDKHSIHICSIENDLYSQLLAQIDDFPLVFYYKGNIKTEEGVKHLAVVGTRHSSIRCQSRVESVLEELSATKQELVIVSGLAYGIDASAHRASLKYGLRTFAVLGHGLHMIYPASHKNLAETILDSGGALISEFPCIVKTHPSNFLRRNRIVAGLCHATLIAESAHKGGAMSTANLALSYNREVMAFPGRPEDKYSVGCNKLIKENIAGLVENGTDIARIMNFPVEKAQPIQTSLDLFEMSDNAETLLNLLRERGETNIDELFQLTQIPYGEMVAILLQLELERKVLMLPGKKYIVNA